MQILCHKEESNFIFVPAIRTTRNQLWHIKQRKKDFFSSVLSHRVFIFFYFLFVFLYRSRGFCIYLFFFAVCDLMSLFLSYSGLDNECLVGLDDLAFLNGALVHSV